MTFTNKAAKEMLTRLSSMLPINVRGMWIGTFHGLCNRFLRAHFRMANLPQSRDGIMLKGVVSRKKQLIPELINVINER